MGRLSPKTQTQPAEHGTGIVGSSGYAEESVPSFCRFDKADELLVHDQPENSLNVTLCLGGSGSSYTFSTVATGHRWPEGLNENEFR